MGLSLRPRDAYVPLTHEEMIEGALVGMRNQGQLTKVKSVRYDDTEDLIIQEVKDVFGFTKDAPAMRCMWRVAGPMMLNEGTATSTLLRAFARVGKDERHRVLSGELIDRLDRQVQELKKLGKAGEARAAQRIQDVQADLSGWDDDFWREQTLGRIDREIRPLLKGETPQRPRVVAMPETK